MAAIIQALSSTEAESAEWQLRQDMAAVFRVSARLHLDAWRRVLDKEEPDYAK